MEVELEGLVRRGDSRGARWGSWAQTVPGVIQEKNHLDDRSKGFDGKS